MSEQQFLLLAAAAIALAAATTADNAVQKLQFYTAESDNNVSGPTLIGSVRDRLPRGVAVNFTGDWSQVSYTLMNVMPAHAHIAVDQAGNLRSDRSINRERLCHPISSPDCREEAAKDVCRITALLRIEDLKRRENFKLFELSVEVTDRDNSAPRFQLSRTEVYVMENSRPGYSISMPKAEDDDSSGFASCRLNYRLETCEPDGSTSGRPPDPTFVLQTPPNENNGPKEVRLDLAGELDRESIDHYRYCIAAVDSSHTATITVEVRVRDVNDNAPVWTVGQNFSVSVSESRPPDTLLKLTATDADMEFGRVNYKLLKDSSGLFYISSNGELKLKTFTGLDYESAMTHRVVVLAADNGEPPRSITATVTINVLDANDNSPRIDPVSSHVTITENNRVPLHIFNLFVTDKDSGPNGMVTCSLLPDQSGDQKFLLNRSPESSVVTYELKTNHSLDREERSNYRIRVQCIDDGTPALSSQTEIYVTVLDQNDNAPSFAVSPIDFSIPEDAPVGSRVHELRIIDPDQDSHNRANRRFEVSGDGSGHFQVEHRHDRIYSLTTQARFDREAKDQYNFSITVLDTNGSHVAHRTTAGVLVRILDANDCAPQFQLPLTSSGEAARDGNSELHPVGIVWLPMVTIAENASVGTLVTTVSATDCDLGLNGSVLYEIASRLPPVQGRLQQPFQLHPVTGRVVLARGLDTDGPDGRSQYTLELLARDRGAPALTGTARLVVNVADCNDNRPEFVSVGMASLNVTCDQAVLNHRLDMDSGARDADSTEAHRQMRYRLVNVHTLAGVQLGGASPHGFSVEPEAGQVYLSVAPELCTAARYQFTLEVFEPGFPLDRVSRKAVTVVFEGGGRKPGSRDGGGGGGRGDGDSGGDKKATDDLGGGGGDARTLFLVAATLVVLIILVGLILLLAVLLKRRRRRLERSDAGLGNSHSHFEGSSSHQQPHHQQQQQLQQSAVVQSPEDRILEKQFGNVGGIDTGLLLHSNGTGSGRRYDSLGRQRRRRNASLDDDSSPADEDDAASREAVASTMPVRSINYSSQQLQTSVRRHQAAPPTYQAVMMPPHHSIGGSQGYMVCQFPTDQWPASPGHRSGAAAAAAVAAGGPATAAASSVSSVGMSQSRSCSRMIDSKRPSQPSSLKSSYLTVSHV